MTVDERFSGFFDKGEINNYQDILNNLDKYSDEYSVSFNRKEPKCKSREIFQNKQLTNIVFEFKNQFFKKLNKKQSLQNWVDIENEYYYQLKEIVKITNQNSETKLTLVKELNKEFEQVRILLEKYLKDKIFNNYEFKNSGQTEWYDFYEIFKPISIYDKQTNKLDEFTKREDKRHIKNIYESQKKEENVTESYLLNFNYTPTLNVYESFIDKTVIRTNFIHGQVNDIKNPINFGFGDEMDDDYKLIENINDNEYLRNFKSFQYLQNSNYNKLLSYINSGKFQVYILGHSCGLSDRTLLNTIFEHKYCCSIKVFYHKKNEDDNYTDIIQNISRHFDDKQKMRSLVVNKTLCQPLPQTKLIKKIT